MRHRIGCRKTQRLIASSVTLWSFTFSIFSFGNKPGHPSAYPQNGTPQENSPQIDTQIDPSALPETTLFPIEITEAHFVPPPDWAQIQESVLRDAQPMVHTLSAELQKLRSRFSPSQLNENLTKNETKWEIPGFRGELNQVDGRPMLRIVHHATRLALLYIPHDIAEDSPHLRQIIARQHIDAGEADPKGRKPGRDTVVIRYAGLTSDTLQTAQSLHRYFPRHPPGSPAWWNDYSAATYTTPHVGAYALASYCAALQVGAAACIGGLRVALGDGNIDFEYSPMILSGLFAALIGMFASSYRVWTYRGSQTSKILKLTSIGLLYAYSLAIVRGGSATVFSITDPECLLLHATIHTNTLLNQKGRVAWQKLAEIRENLRYSSGQYDLAPLVEKLAPEINVRDSSGKSTATVSRASFFNQTLYLIPFSFKLGGLIGIGAKVTLPLAGWQLDSGPLLLVASIPAALWVVSRYAAWVKNGLRRQIALLHQTAGPTANPSENDKLVELEQQEAVVTKIESEINTEYGDIWRDALYRPHRFLKSLALVFSDSIEDIRQIHWPILKNTAQSAIGWCAKLLTRAKHHTSESTEPHRDADPH